MKLPKGWSNRPIADFADVVGGIQKGPHREPGANAVRYLTVAHVQRNRVFTDDPRFFEVTPTELARWRLEPQDVLIIEGNGSADQIGRTALFRGDIPDCVHQNHVIRVRVDHSMASAQFLNAFLNSSIGQATVQNLSMSSSGLRTLSVGRIREIPIPFPPLPEQRKIAEILTTWDEALEKLDALIAAQDRRKQGLMQQLLAGRRRLKGFAGKWKTVFLSEVAAEEGERNRSTLDRSRLYAVTKAEGMVPMRERVQGATVHRCKLVERGWFAYNPMRINIGSIARWEGQDPVMVSGDYVVFRADETRLLSDFLHYVRQSSAWAGFVGASGNGSVRIRIWFDDLGRFKFRLPPLDEQRAIDSVLDAHDEELRLLRAQRTALDQQKRGLMQRLLTGRVRVGRTGTDRDRQGRTGTEGRRR